MMAKLISAIPAVKKFSVYPIQCLASNFPRRGTSLILTLTTLLEGFVLRKNGTKPSPPSNFPCKVRRYSHPPVIPETFLHNNLSNIKYFVVNKVKSYSQMAAFR